METGRKLKDSEGLLRPLEGAITKVLNSLLSNKEQILKVNIETAQGIDK